MKQENTKKGLSVVDIGTFCMLAKKYEKEIEENGGKNPENNDYFIEECSKSISEMLKLMDKYQQMLWKYGHKEECAEQLLAAKNGFENGLNMMKEVLRAFDVGTCGKRK